MGGPHTAGLKQSLRSPITVGEGQWDCWMPGCALLSQEGQLKGTEWRKEQEVGKETGGVRGKEWGTGEMGSINILLVLTH